MSRWQEFPLRPQGQPWPGLNTRGGRTDPGQGFLEDGSFNAIVNEVDILEKRKGFVRGLDERFTGPVCGLFRYTDNCGVEYLVVADSSGIFVRTPFNIPVFLGSDSLPNDDFEAAEIDTDRWSSGTEFYRTFLGSMTIGLLTTQIDVPRVPEERFMQWFKPAALSSYQVEVQYAFTVGSGQQNVAVIIKRTGDTYLIANVQISDAYTVVISLVQAGVVTELDGSELEGAELANGFLRLAYNADTRTVTCRVIPSGGAQVTLSKVLNEAQDNNLGQDSALGITNAVLADQPEILNVRGGALGS